MGENLTQPFDFAECKKSRIFAPLKYLILKIMIHKLKTLMGGVILLLAAVLVSCSKNPNPETGIVGKWYAESVLYQGYEDGILVSEGTEYFTSSSIIFDFKADGTGQTITSDKSSDLFIDPVTWVIVGDELFIMSEIDGTVSFDIVSISFDVMTLSQNYEEGLYKDVYTYTFKKL